VVVLRLSAVPRGRAIGLLATNGIPLRIARTGRRAEFLASSWASCAVAAAPSFQTCFACVHMYIYMCVCIYVYVCMCADMYIYRYVHVRMYMYMYAFIHMCMCMRMHICA